MRSRVVAVAALLLLAAGCEIAGCRVNNMVQQPRTDPNEASEVFADGSSARPLPPGTVPRAEPPVLPASVTVDEALIARGRDRFEVFCSPCHDLAGTGAGTVVKSGYPAPPSFHSDRLRAMPDATIMEVIRGGRGKMPPYGSQVGPWDRVAVVAWIRVLQRSRTGTLADLAPEARQRLLESDGEGP